MRRGGDAREATTGEPAGFGDPACARIRCGALAPSYVGCFSSARSVANDVPQHNHTERYSQQPRNDVSHHTLRLWKSKGSATSAVRNS